MADVYGDAIRKLQQKFAPNADAIGRSWPQSPAAPTMSSQKRARTAASGRGGSLADVAEQALQSPGTKIGNAQYITDVAGFIKNNILSGNQSRSVAAQDAYKSLSPAEREQVDALIIAAIPNARSIGEGRATDAISPDASEIFRTLDGQPLSPERQAAIDSVTDIEESPVLYGDNVRPDAPLSRRAPQDRMPPARETAAQEEFIKKGITQQLRSEGLKIGSPEYNSELNRRLRELMPKESNLTPISDRPEFRGPNAEITVPPGGVNEATASLSIEQRQKLREAYLVRYERERDALRSQLTAQIDPKSTRGVRYDPKSERDIKKQFRKADEAGLSPDAMPLQERLDYFNSRDARTEEAIKNLMPDLTPAEVDARVDEMIQQRKTGINRDPDPTQWRVPQSDQLRLNIAAQEAAGEIPLTAKERRILATAPGETAGTARGVPSKTEADTGEQSNLESLYRSFTDTLGYNPLAPLDRRASLGAVDPSKRPQNVNTVSSSRRQDDILMEDDSPAISSGDEFDPEELVNQGLDAALEETAGRSSGSRRPTKTQSNSRVENLSIRATDELYAKAMRSLRPGANVRGSSPAKFGYSDPEVLARDIVRAVNSGEGGPLVPSQMTDTVVADLAKVFRSRFGDDLGASSLPSEVAPGARTVESRVGTDNAQDAIAKFKARQNTQSSTAPGTASTPTQPTSPRTALERQEQLAEEAAGVPTPLETWDGSTPNYGFTRRFPPISPKDMSFAGEPPVPSRKSVPEQQPRPEKVGGEIPEFSRRPPYSMYDADELERALEEVTGPSAAPVKTTQVGTPDRNVVTADAQRVPDEVMERNAGEAEVEDVPPVSSISNRQATEAIDRFKNKGGSAPNKPNVPQKLIADARKWTAVLSSAKDGDPRLQAAMDHIALMKEARDKIAAIPGADQRALADFDQFIMSPLTGAATQRATKGPSPKPTQAPRGSKGQPPRNKGDLTETNAPPPEKLEGASTTEISDPVESTATAAPAPKPPVPSIIKPPRVPSGFNQPPVPSTVAAGGYDRYVAAQKFQAVHGRAPTADELDAITTPVDVDFSVRQPELPYRTPDELRGEYTAARQQVADAAARRQAIIDNARGVQTAPGEDLPLPRREAEAAANADAQSATKDAESDKAVETSTRAAEEADGAAAAKRVEEATSASPASAKPQAAGSGWLIRKAKEYLSDPVYAPAKDLIQGSVGGATWAARKGIKNGIPLAIGAYVANQYRDPILDSVEPYLPEGWREGIETGMDAFSGAVDAGLDAAGRFSAGGPGGQGGPNQGPGGPGMGLIPGEGPINSVQDELPVARLPSMMPQEDEVESLRRIRDIISVTRPRSIHAIGTNRNPTPY